MRPILTITSLIVALFSAAYAHPDHKTKVPHWQEATGWPDRIITTYGGDPQTTLSITWRTDASVAKTIAQIAPASPDARFDLAAETLRAETEALDLAPITAPEGPGDSMENHGLGRVHYHSITFEGLEPATLYAWRVQGARGQWSEWFQTRTAPSSGPVEFVYFGDAQNGIRSHWSRVIRAAYQAAPHADFFLHAGDLVQSGDSDYNWAEWFSAGSFIHAVTPTVPVPGNHENITVFPFGKRLRVRTPMWRPQFTLPVVKELPENLHEMAYDVRVSNDLHIFVIDSARTTRKPFEQQAAWLDRALRKSDARWKIVSMHHPYFVPPSFDRRDRDKARREALAPVIDRHAVDLVMAGHIHTYARSTLSETSERTSRSSSGDEKGIKTIFTISSSGAKNSDLYSDGLADSAGDGEPDLGDLSLDRVAGNTPMFQVIRIDGDTLHYEARMATGETYDAFTVTKKENGRKFLVEGEPDHGATRLFSNTGPYREWWDLR